MTCPICKKEVAPGGAYAPFCSERCRLIDLGNWSDESYRVASEDNAQPKEEDDLEDR